MRVILNRRETVMKNLKATIAIALLVFASTTSAGDGHGHKKHHSVGMQALYDYAEVIEVYPLYREARVSTPIRECREEPVYHTRKPHKSASGMLVGGLVLGAWGGGRQRLYTALGCYALL